jgi:hypothetical protein
MEQRRIAPLGETNTPGPRGGVGRRRDLDQAIDRGEPWM